MYNCSEEKPISMPNNRRKAPPHSGDMDTYQVRTLQKKRTTNFREDETKLLISLWGSPVIQNKLYLTHRKAPVMRLLAANMQQRGFCRTPDEIKTRIRNLKCLYHRIKRTMVTGSGIGTVDPDWPHFKAMDAILGKEGQNKQDKKIQMHHEELPHLEGPRCEDIKQELDIDINDDMESWNGNDSMGGSDYEENHIPATSIAKPIEAAAPSMAQMSAQAQVSAVLPIAPQPSSLAPLRPNGAIPLPLLILNHGIPPQLPPPQPPEKKSADGKSDSREENSPSDLVNILREILSVQSQQLELEKQKFELEQQRLEFDRVVGTQLMTLVPMVGGLLQRLVYPPVSTHNHNVEAAESTNEAESKAYQDKQLPEYDILKDSKILRTVLERGIKKYMMADETRDSNKDNDEDSENDDSGLNNNLLIENDNSNSNSK